MGKLWRGYKNELSRTIRKLANSTDIAEELAHIKPADVKAHEWDDFVRHRRSLKFQVCMFYLLIHFNLFF